MNDFLARLESAFPPQKWRDVTILAAVSGGADSVALLRGLALAKSGASHGEGRIICAHFNHRLRAADSDADEAFVRELGERLKIETLLGTAMDDLAAASGDGLEAAAREARYEFLIAAARKHGARYIATAHTADDQAETILHRILRGTGIAGLAGIPRVREISPGISLVRPLLDVTRDEVLAFLRSLGESWREDASNLDLSFTRNRIRRELLPYLEREFSPDVRQALLRLGKLAADNQECLEAQVAALGQRCLRKVPGGVAVDCSLLVNTHRHLVREALIHVWTEQGWPLQAMTVEKWEGLAKLAQGHQGPSAGTALSRTFPGNIRAEKKGEELWLTRPGTDR